MEQARIVREYVGGAFTLFDALALDPQEFKAIFVCAAANNMAAIARVKKGAENQKRR